MPEAHFRFYAELNDLLRPGRRAKWLPFPVRTPVSVKHAIETFGVPHTEVDLVLVNGCSVDFAHTVAPGDRVSVFPVFESFDISAITRVRPKPLRELRFVLDCHLGRLAAYLRMLGFDTLYTPGAADAGLALTAARERRVLLTRDRGLLQRRLVQRGYCIRESLPRRQLEEVVRRFDLAGLARPFRRCLRCNAALQPASASQVRAIVPPRVLEQFRAFQRCPACNRAYWQGSHYDRMLEWISALLPARDSP
jgi:hypothetical protein